MTTLSWDLVGGNPAPGEPGTYEHLAGMMAETANNAVEARSKLDRFSSSVDSSIWRGEAADAFREKIQELPPRLQKLHESYDTASKALSGYGRVLADLQPKANALLEQAHAARNDENTQRQRRDAAQAQAGADPAAVPASTATFDSAIDAAQNRLRDLRSQVDHLRDERTSAEGRAVGGLHQAHDQGIPNDSWWERAWHAIDKWVDEHVDILKKISGILKIVSAIAGLLSFIPFLAPICGPIALLAGGAALLLDAALCATGNGDWKALLVDAALMALPGVGKLARMGFKAAQGTRVGSAIPHALSVVRQAKGVGAVRGAMQQTRLFARAAKCRLVGRDPIDMATGEMILQQDPDLFLPAVLAFTLQRTYRSAYRVGRWFGPGWSSTIEHRLEVDDLGVCYAADDGLLFAYPMPGEGETVLPQEGPRLPLTRDSGGFAVAHPDSGQTFHFLVGTGDQPQAILPLAAITDRNGNRIDLDYDADGSLTAIRHSGGYHLDVDTQRGLITEIRLRMPEGEPGLVLMRYDYDEAGNLVGVVNSSGRPLRFDYDEHGRMTRWEDRNGTWYRYTYDEQDRCVATSGTAGCLDGTIVYDKSERRTVETNSLGHATTYHFNDLLQMERVVDPLGGATSYEWDRYDRKLAETDPLGRTTRWTYDETGNLVGVTRPDGSRITLSYSDLRLPVAVTGPDGAVWRREYDDRGDLVAEIDPLGATTRYAYDERGCQTELIDALGHIRRIESDAAGLPISFTDPLGATTRYARDPMGRVVELTDALGGLHRFTWTVEGRLASRTLPDGAIESWVYDAEGNLLEEVDALGQVTRMEIGPFDLPRSQTTPDGAQLAFDYDTELRLSAVANPQGLVWRYEYDAAGNVTRETDFNGRVLAYSHDAGGQLVERTNGAGETTSLVRDMVGNIVEQRSGDVVSTFSYDALGRLTRATNADCELALDYDLAGRVRAETCNGRAVTSAYDPLGRRVERRTPSGAVSVWDYGATGEPLALHVGGRSLRFAYDQLGREVERRFADSVVIAQSWDASNRLLSQALTVSVPGSAEDARLVERRSYTYRVDGYMSGVDDLLSGQRHIDLDPVGRITGVIPVGGAAWTERYDYDAAGNVTFATWPAPIGPASNVEPAPNDVLDAQGEREYAGTLIERAGKVRYEHDSQGRVVLRQEKRLSGKPRTWRYAWDADDRLTSVLTPDGTRWRYRYDPLGRRIAKERLDDAGDAVLERLEFMWDGLVLAEQTRSDVEDSGAQISGVRWTTWDWEPGTFRPVIQTQRRSLRDAPQEMIDEEFHAIVTDLVGTPTELVTPGGDLAWHQRVTVWGAPVSEGPPGVECLLRFPGQYSDVETQGHYNFFRYYDPSVAGYSSCDPLGPVDGLSAHAYVPNALQWIDPLGLTPQNYVVRLQAQGGKNRLEESVVLSGENPVTAQEGLEGLKALKGKLSKKDLEARAEPFKKAERFISQAPAGGGVAPPGKSFALPRSDVRVDVEVLRGINFQT